MVTVICNISINFCQMFSLFLLFEPSMHASVLIRQYWCGASMTTVDRANNMESYKIVGVLFSRNCFVGLLDVVYKTSSGCIQT